MVDFAVFFLVIKYIVDFVRGQFMVNRDAIIIGLITSFVVCAVFALFLKAPKDDKKWGAKALFRRLTIILGSLIAIGSVGFVWPNILLWVKDAFGIAPQQVTNTSVITGLTLFSAGSLVASRFFTKEPNNNSLCNTRQVYKWAGYLFAIGLGFFVLWVVSDAAFVGTVKAIFYATELVSILLWFYDPFIYILSNLIQSRQKPYCKPTPNKLNRFAIIGCAHNEAAVIDQLVKSIYATTYPKNKYDIYVICDNCNDNTAQVVREAGAIAMERNNQAERGKGYGLKWMFNILEEKRKAGDEYDAYIVLDADNLVNEEFLDSINDRMNEGHEMLQTYLGCKNPRDTWISASYSYTYWVSNDLYQRAHSKVGLSCQMGGTGMVIRPSVLDDIGWETDSLTEDLVLTARYILLRNRAACWVHEARLYDEKPLKLTPSIRQRTRWMQGHMAAMFKFAPKLFFSGLKNLSLKQLDMAFYLARPFLNLILLLSYALRLFINVFTPESALSLGFIMSNNSSLLLMIGSFTLQLFVLFSENYARYIPVFLIQLVFSFTWYPAIFRGLIKRNERYWVSTVHTRNISIQEVKEDAQLLEAKERLKGLDNLHRLPLGQILLKATVISKSQLDEALKYQAEHGGFLGDIIVEQKAVSHETLDAYLKLQQTMKESAKQEGRGDDHLRLGDILVNSGLITKGQLEMALDYQKKHGGYLGDCLIITKCLPIDLLQVFLDVQKLLDANFISPHSAKQLINGVLQNSADNLGTILWKGGLISRQQLDFALEKQSQSGGQIGALLVECGFIGQETIDLILRLQSTGRAFLSDSAYHAIIGTGEVPS